ncbi:L-galactose dehydrogenase-like [Sarcoptes scabiei]|nr:L-galactose dehydrogenase-like [Sarcoptes scabiei]
MNFSRYAMEIAMEIARHPHRKRCRRCRPGCRCSKGYVRKYADGNGPCIKLEHCKHHKGSCHEENQKYSLFSGCDPTCLEPYGTRRCTSKIRPGCACRRGYVRRERDGTGRCVHRRQCGQCPKHEKHSICENPCQPTCDEPYPLCTMICKEGCLCKEGYVRVKSGGPCIKRQHCENYKSTAK